MSNNTSSSSSGGIGFLGLLTIAFIVLKLTNYINWSWWWVLSPLWGGLVLIFGSIGIILFTAYLVSCFNDNKTKRFSNKIFKVDKK